MKKTLLFLFLLVLGVTQGWAADVNFRFYRNNGTFVDGTTGYYKTIVLDNTETFRELESKFPEVIRTGYTFKGWNSAANGNGADMNLDSKPAATTSWYAKWQANTTQITFQDGTESVVATYGSAMPTGKTKPTKTGYVFGGYYDKENGDGTQYYKDDMSSSRSWDKDVETFTLYAKWTPAKYTLSFDANGGGNAPTRKTVTYLDTYPDLGSPTRTNYIFKGWNTMADGSGTMITAGSTVEITSITTLYAQWVGKEFTISFNLNCTDDNASVNPATKVYNYGGKLVEMPTPSRIGWQFDGWYSNASNFNNTNKKDENSDVPSSDLTLYAKWTQKQYTVTYDANNQESVNTTTDNTQTYGAVYKLPVFRRQGYTLGWYTDSQGGEEVTANSVYNIDGDQTLYARWKSWGMVGEGTADSPYQISTSEELMKFAKIVNDGYPTACAKLMNDINMTGKAWIPIGLNSAVDPSRSGDYFGGTFDGNGYVISNLTMAENYTYARAGLIGYAKGATIKNVVVNNATIYAVWQAAAVCGRIDGGTVSNCGSYGTLSINVNATDNADAQCISGVVNTDGVKSNATTVTSVWSTFSDYYSPNSKNDDIRKNQVVGTWAYANNKDYNGYTQNSDNSGTKKNWIYVKSDLATMKGSGALCYALNGNVDGGTAWTQTFGDTEYANSPRPTNRGLAVYKEGEKYYNRKYTYTFDANGGSACPDLYVKRYSDNATLVYPTFAQPTNAEYTFVRWADENEDAVAEGAQFDENKTFHAHWMLQPSANVDPDNTANSYVTFYDSKYAYTIPTGVTAYKGKVNGDNLVLTAITTGVIPQGEAVILKSTTSGPLDLVTVESNDVKDSENILKGSDAELSSVPENCYILTYGYNKLGFYEQPTTTALKAHKAYVIWSGQTSLAKCLTMKFEDEATGVEDMTVTENIDKDIYNLNGMRLTKLQKGINIVGGNKVVVK